MRKLIIYDDVRYLLSSSTEEAVGEFHRQLPSIKADIVAMRAAQPLWQKSFHRRDGWDIKEQFGITTVVFNSKITKKGGKQKITEQYESVTYTYVLLVELGTEEVTIGGSDGFYLPKGFAVFEPTSIADGEGPNGEGIVNLKFTGYTNSVAENIDPDGIIGQPTYRVGWCKSDTIEQVKRVDQGWYAYDGDAELEEVTGIYSDNNVWTYEDIEFTTHWISVEPGPPPSDICGYTWSIYTQYGGDTSAGDYHTERYLFYTIKSGLEIIYWWPPEFSQKIVEHQRWHQENMISRAVDYDTLWGGDINYWDFGLVAAFSEYMFPNGFAKISVLYDASRRIWGNIWGNVTYPVEDNSGMDTFPYKEYEEFLQWDYAIASDYNRWFSDGVYVKDAWQSMFITYLERQNSDDIYSQTWSMLAGKRSPVLETAFKTPSILTDRQRELMLGNEDSFTWVLDPFTSLWEYEESRDVTGLWDMVVNCGGLEYIISKRIDPDIGKAFRDCGIFTKVNTGISGSNEVDAAKVEPIYAYSVLKDYGDDSAFIYGMVLDSKHYRTEEFSAVYENWDWKVTIPELKSADLATANVRIGIKKTINTAAPMETEYETE